MRPRLFVNTPCQPACADNDGCTVPGEICDIQGTSGSCTGTYPLANESVFGMFKRVELDREPIPIPSEFCTRQDFLRQSFQPWGVQYIRRRRTCDPPADRTGMVLDDAGTNGLLSDEPEYRPRATQAKIRATGWWRGKHCSWA